MLLLCVRTRLSFGPSTLLRDECVTHVEDLKMQHIPNAANKFRLQLPLPFQHALSLRQGRLHTAKY